jgi:23S rRNA (guanosine2251-2'-O)-methyltransferase
MGLDSNQRTLARAELQSAAINHSATHPRVRFLQGCIKKGFVPCCQVCDDIFMVKPPKRTNSGKKPPHTGGRRNERQPEKAAEWPDRTSKRGSFRKREQDDKRKPSGFGGRPADKRDTRKDEPRREAFRDSRTPNKIPPRPIAREGRKNFDDRPREPKSPRLKADLFGLHAVREAWQNPKRYVHNLYITENAMKEFEPHLKTDAKRPEPMIVTKDELDKAFPVGTVHQGIGLSCQPLAEVSITDIIIRGTLKPKSVIVMLDQVTDPHNIGAIMRSACAFGADGVVMQSKHAPEMSGVLAKTACGAMEHIDVAYETNLSRALEKLQENHYTVIGLDEHAEKTFAQLPKYDRAVIVLGAEGPGIRRLIREHCNVLVKLPTNEPITSLNVSNAAAVALYALTA